MHKVDNFFLLLLVLNAALYFCDSSCCSITIILGPNDWVAVSGCGMFPRTYGRAREIAPYRASPNPDEDEEEETRR